MARDIGVWLFGQSVGTLSPVNGRLRRARTQTIQWMACWKASRWA